MTPRRAHMISTRVSREVRDLVDALCERRLMTQAELIRDWVYDGVARDVARITQDAK